MKRFFLLMFLFLLLPAKAFYAPGGWETDLKAARAAAAKQNKPLLIVISGPDWDASSKLLHKDVINDHFFNMIIQKYAVCLFLHQPKVMFGARETPKNIVALKNILPGNAIPRYAIVSADLQLLAKPKKRSLTEFARAISIASVKTNGTAVKEFRQVLEHENKKNAIRLKKQRKNAARKSHRDTCRSSSSSCRGSAGSSSVCGKTVKRSPSTSRSKCTTSSCPRI